MSIITCPECGKDVSSLAMMCPSCGYPISQIIGTDNSQNPKLTNTVNNSVPNASSISALVERAIAYYNSEDYKGAFPLFQQAAELGSANAAFYAGIMYHYGNGTEIDYKKAFEYYLKAIERSLDNDVLYNNIGVLYLTGQGTKTDYSKAEYYLKKAKELGCQKAEENLAELESRRKKDPAERFKRKHNIPDKCPSCGSIEGWVNLGHSREGYSIYKAALPTLIVGPIGLLAGALGHHSLTYRCNNCGYEKVYDIDFL